MRVLWIEDQRLVVESLATWLRGQMPQVLLDIAGDLDTAVRGVSSVGYELVLMDWWLNGCAGNATISALRAAGCSAPIVVVSGDDRPAVFQQAMTGGAAAYVCKKAEPATLVETLAQVMEGKVVPPEVTPAALTGQLPSLDPLVLYPDLTLRQADVFRLLVRGMTNKDIAQNLAISETTVKSHVRAILQVVGVSKRGEASYAARLRGG